MRKPINVSLLPRFLKHESAQGIILFLCATISLIVANFPLAHRPVVAA